MFIAQNFETSTSFLNVKCITVTCNKLQNMYFQNDDFDMGSPLSALFFELHAYNYDSLNIINPNTCMI